MPLRGLVAYRVSVLAGPPAGTPLTGFPPDRVWGSPLSAAHFGQILVGTVLTGRCGWAENFPVLSQ